MGTAVSMTMFVQVSVKSHRPGDRLTVIIVAVIYLMFKFRVNFYTFIFSTF